ncbi:MAG TPA: TetR/AcrR family transcriptional regulator [Chloroflexia bacterium]|nr:TetR/AcrR family transcriptional regulator [Chloroflexia bacterium]
MTNQIENGKEKHWTHRADNYQRLVEAGYKVLSEKGYEATTVKEVAHEAGVSPGLFHYYFASKDKLLLAVLQESGTRYGQLMKEAGDNVPLDQLPQATINAARQRVKQEPQWYRLRFELFALALRNPTFLPVLGDLLSFIRQMTAEPLQHFTAGDEPKAQALAAIVLACFDGLALQQLAQPDADLTKAYELLLEFIQKVSSDN